MFQLFLAETIVCSQIFFYCIRLYYKHSITHARNAGTHNSDLLVVELQVGTCPLYNRIIPAGIFSTLYEILIIRSATVMIYHLHCNRISKFLVVTNGITDSFHYFWMILDKNHL